MERKAEPSWAVAPPDGLRCWLECVKGNKILHTMPICPPDNDNNHVAWHEGANALLFGRWGGTDCVIEHPSCSRQHAFLGWDTEGRLTLEDLGSAAGSRVNGDPVAGGLQVPLKPGDTVAFGESTRSYIVRERRPNLQGDGGTAPIHDQAAVRAEIDKLKSDLVGEASETAEAQQRSPNSDAASSAPKKRKHEKKEKKGKKHKKEKHKKEKKHKRQRGNDGDEQEDEDEDEDGTGIVYTHAQASHILVKDKDLAWDLLAELEDGDGDTTFEALAAKHSTCPSGKRSRGDLGKFGKGQMVKEFEEVAFDPAYKIGIIHGPIKTEFGYHLIRVKHRAGIDASAVLS